MSVRKTVVFTTSSNELPSPSSSEERFAMAPGELCGNASVYERAVNQPKLA